MQAIRRGGVVAAVAATIALACLAGDATKSHASTQAATAAPVLANAFATAMLQTVIGGVKDEAISAGFGSLLDFIGLNGDAAATEEQVNQLDARVQRVEEALAQTNKTVNQIKTDVSAARIDINTIKDATLRNSYDQAANAALDIVSEIDTALRKVKAANAADTGRSGNSTRRDAENYISNNIDGAAEKLQTVVFGDPNGNFGGTPLIDAAFAVATGNDMLTHTEATHIRYLVDLYSTYESLAAAITAEYRKARSGYDKADVKSYLSDWIDTIKAQMNGRRDVPPTGTVVDSRTLLMWTLAPHTVGNPGIGPVLKLAGSYGDWGVPGPKTWTDLITGYASTPKEFLRVRGFDVSKGNVVVSNQPRNYTVCRPGYTTYDLSVAPPTLGTAYAGDGGKCRPGTHGGATTYQVCVNKAKAGRGGGSIRVCQTRTDQQQVDFNNRILNTSHQYYFFGVRRVPVGSFLPSSYPGS
jgi:hypothetical protein